MKITEVVMKFRLFFFVLRRLKKCLFERRVVKAIQFRRKLIFIYKTKCEDLEKGLQYLFN